MTRRSRVWSTGRIATSFTLRPSIIAWTSWSNALRRSAARVSSRRMPRFACARMKPPPVRATPTSSTGNPVSHPTASMRTAGSSPSPGAVSLTACAAHQANTSAWNARPPAARAPPADGFVDSRAAGSGMSSIEASILCRTCGLPRWRRAGTAFPARSLRGRSIIWLRRCQAPSRTPTPLPPADVGRLLPHGGGCEPPCGRGDGGAHVDQRRAQRREPLPVTDATVARFVAKCAPPHARLPDLRNLHATTLLLAEVPAMNILICREESGCCLRVRCQ